MPIQPNRILVHYGEISLKGKNCVFFERALGKNIEHRLRRNLQTKSQHHKVNRLEERSLPNYRSLVEDTLADAVRLEFDGGERIG